MFRTKKASFTSVGELYFEGSFFASDNKEAKTIGKPLIGADFENILRNRRTVKGRLSPEGNHQLQAVIEKVKLAFPGREVKAEWDIHCGCSMCPCSPGYRIKVDTPLNYGERSNGKNRFSVWVNRNETGAFHDFKKPTNKWAIGKQELDRLEELFATSRPKASPLP